MAVAETAKVEALAAQGLSRLEIRGLLKRELLPEESRAAAAGRGVWKLKEAKRREERGGAKSGAERMKRLRARENEVDLPPVANPKRRARCERSLVKFLETYCMGEGGFLEARPSKAMYGIIETIQAAVTSSRWYHIRMPRGHGKTSFVKGGIAYALAYGYRRYVISVCAAGGNASSMIRDVFALFERNEAFAEDFPEIAVPIRRLEGKVQRAKSLTVNGEPCDIHVNASEIILPTVRGSVSSGGVINAVGFKANARGKVRGSLRPDLVIFDDLQDEELAKSPDRVREAVLNVEKNFLNLGGHRKRIAALMTSTPIEPDDLSETFAAKDNWYTSTFRMVEAWPETKDTLWEEYRSILRHEVIRGRDAHVACNRFYRAHRDLMDRGAKVLNPDNYDRRLEVSGIQHAMNLYFNGEEQFMSEYQMQPMRRQMVFTLRPGVVVSRTRRDWKPYFIPPESVMTVCATDLNPAYGYSSAMVTFDRVATATVVWYGIHATDLHKERMTEAEYRAAVYGQLVAFAARLKAETAARSIRLDAWAVDAGGDQFEPVQRLRRNAKDLGLPFEVVPMVGKAGRTWNPFVRSKIRNPINETVECGDVNRDGERQRWTNFNADFWRETMQRAWLGEIGTPGGLSLFGGEDGVRHDDFALQVTAEQLRKKELAPDGRWRYEWTGGDAHRHDYGDAMTMCLAVAGNRGLTQGVEFTPHPARRTAKIAVL